MLYMLFKALTEFDSENFVSYSLQHRWLYIACNIRVPKINKLEFGILSLCRLTLTDQAGSEFRACSIDTSVCIGRH